MKRILFYFENEWAFGTIHNELCKYLWGHGFNCNILDWRIPYSVEEIKEIIELTDIFVTTPAEWKSFRPNYNIPPEKTVLIAHGRYDLQIFKNTNTTPLNLFYKIGAVSEWLIDVAKQIGIDHDIQLLPLGINYSTFKTTPSSFLKTVGFAASFHQKDDFTKDQILSPLAQPKFHKRGWLVEQAVRSVGLDFKVAQRYHNSFITMPGFYKNVDAVVIASTEEGAGLPVLEAAASGKLIISTPVGHWYKKSDNIGGYVVPVEENQFLEKTVELLNHYKNNPVYYRQKCLEIQEHAKNYDWNNVIDIWANFLS